MRENCSEEEVIKEKVTPPQIETQPPAQICTEPIVVPTPTQTGMTPTIPAQATPKPKPYRQPQLLTLPSTVALPVDHSDQQFLSYSSQLRA